MKKDPYLEKALALMNGSLIGSEEFLIDDFNSPELPVLFVIGTQRAGTTVLTQSLASLYHISYPSNLIARFWRAPYIGALLSKSLRVNEEKMLFSSEFGATGKINGPHEFSYFWRHWLPESAVNAKPWRMSDQQEELFKKHFAAWQSVNNEPLLFKNLLEIIPNIENLSRILPAAVFLNIIRDDIYVIQSTYESRKNYGDDYQAWFGVKPKNYLDIMKIKDPLIQVTEQVHYIKNDIKESLNKLPDERYINISYEEFISSPEKVINTIESKFKLKHWRRNDRSIDELKLKSGNKIRLGSGQVEKVEKHLKKLNPTAK